MKKFALASLSFVLLSLITGCEKKEDKFIDTGYTFGIFIVNEGSFNQNNGSISYVSELNNVIVNDIFNAANGRPLGDIVQSMTVVNDSLGVIVVNNSAKLEIVRLSSFEVVSEPLAVDYPRYFLQVSNDKGYLTSGNLAGNVIIVDLNTFTVTGTISVGFGPEVMLQIDNLVYIANSGGWASDSTISVVNVQTDKIEETIYVEKIPVDMTVDSEGFLWVYCKGYTDYANIETDSYLQKIDPDDHSIVWQGKVGKALDYATSPAKCAASPDGNIIYYIRPDGIYSVNASNPVIAEDPIIAGNFYGLEVHPENGRVYVFESSFTGNGTMKIFEPDGTILGQGMVGIGPNGAVFNLQ